MIKDFEEIGHSGGKITFNILTSEDGTRGYQVQFSSNRPVPQTLVGVYALPQGAVVERIYLGGIGQPWNPPPFDDCVAVLIASDSQGHFGHNCPHCGGYWRSGPWPRLCPYCARWSNPHQFLSEAQMRYVQHYCNILFDALESNEDDSVEIDMDVVADAACKNTEKPSFYISEESQQQKFHCTACGEFNDILGRLGYCSQCGTRNDLAEFENNIVPSIRTQLNAGSIPEDCVRDAVASFDSLSRQIGRELAKLVPMSPRRKQHLLKQGHYDLSKFAEIMLTWFDIDIFSGIRNEERNCAIVMFHRRHVYEHNAGEVDQKYLNDSGDKSVRLRERIHETIEDTHIFLGILVKLFRNTHGGFHTIFPPRVGPIKAFEEKKSRMSTDSN